MVSIAAVLPLPISVDALAVAAHELTREHGEGLLMRQSHGRMLVLIGPTPELDCWCRRCDEHVRGQLAKLDTASPWWMWNTVMLVCQDCGNKRCPRATWHDNDCSRSNEPGQAGSDYA